METSHNDLTTALRVLTAIVNKQEPGPEDIAKLKAFAPLLDTAPLDILACEVIQQAVRRRADDRAKAAE